MSIVFEKENNYTLALFCILCNNWKLFEDVISDCYSANYKVFQGDLTYETRTKNKD